MLKEMWKGRLVCCHQYPPAISCATGAGEVQYDNSSGSPAAVMERRQKVQSLLQRASVWVLLGTGERRALGGSGGSGSLCRCPASIQALPCIFSLEA